MIWMMTVIFGIGMPLVLYSVNLRTSVTSESIRVTYAPAFSRTIHISGIRNCEAVEYRPFRDYGGWGTRWSARNGWVYSAAGNQGVRLTLNNGKQILIGSHDHEQLAYAIQSAMRNSRSGLKR